MPIQENIDKAILFIKLWEKIDLGNYESKYREILHPNYRGGTRSIENTWNEIWQYNIDSTIKYGPGIDSFLARLPKYALYIGNIKFKILDIFNSEDKVIIHSILTFKHIGETMGYPATGKKISIESFITFAFSDGLITSSTFNIDFYRWLREIGASLIEEGNETKMKKYLDTLRAQNILPALDS
jgi:predicted ester cyclase